jgi:RNA polymerase-binding transcription factor DksA
VHWRTIKRSTKTTTMRKAKLKKPKKAAARRRVPRRWAKHYRQLLALREHLLGEHGILEKDARRPADLATHDFADEAADALNHAVASRVLRAEEDILFEVEAALERISLGTYGVCELSGKKIPQRRLAAIPWTRFTAAAATKLESARVKQRGAVTDRMSPINAAVGAGRSARKR